ncbi:MAG: YlbG family protein [Lactobacillales bacterium]|jgi:uncharacterized protein YlbG (UPF0298 family)|nr:YlbG family protein [Lactobacillales bacterium]
MVIEEKNLLNKEKPFMLQKRRLLVIWVYNLKPIKNLKRFGQIMYISRKMKYVLMYLNEEDVGEVEPKVRRLHFVRYTEYSYRPDIEMNFSDKIGTRSLKELSKENENILDKEEFSKTIHLADNSL